METVAPIEKHQASGGNMSAEGSTNQKLPPMELLVEDMKNNDINVRIGVMKNLSIIARELGPDKTVYELLPFLIQKVHDEDEVFYEMACQISSLLEYIGDEKNIVHLFPY